ncbi:MAG: CBS domain-containing protein [Coleofasciculaceae cyanobacterium SM2_1_6]|nr:CBS domain-containing protein [Coleofasciculaceae cyanobacterium SM2_1_6]
MTKTVAEIMTRDPIAVTPSTPLKEAIQLLAERRISGLPVVDEQGKLVGIISETDLMWQETGAEKPPYVMVLDSIIYLQNPLKYDQEIHKALGQTVGEVMTSHVISIHPDKSIRDATQILQQKKIHRLPVLDEAGKLVGILTRGDIIRAMAADLV